MKVLLFFIGLSVGLLIYAISVLILLAFIKVEQKKQQGKALYNNRQMRRMKR